MPARPMTSRWSGLRCSCSRPWPSSCMQVYRGSKACCAKACGNSVEPELSANSEDFMNRRKFLQSTATLGASFGLTLAAPPFIARAATKELLVAEPVHSTGYLPMYIAMANNYFAESDIAVKIVTIETGSGHTNAVLSGQAFAFIGGPEHNAFAKAKGAGLRAVVHCVDRGNVYICAAKGQDPKDRDWPAYMKGKTIAVGPYGGTPNSIMRDLLGKANPDPKGAVALIGGPNPPVPAAVRGGQAVIGNSTEPMIMQGIRIGFWGEPVFKLAKETR